jgi:rod shape-determining protein MreD
MSRHALTQFGIFRILCFYAFIILMLLLNLITLPILGADAAKLSFLLIGIYFWTIYRPSLLPYPLVFAMGLLLDFLSGGLVGLYPLCFLLMVMIVRGQRRFLLGQSWPVVWAGYCVAVFLMMLTQYLTYAMATGEFLSIIPVGFTLLISCLLYPILLPPLSVFNRFLSD